MIVMEIRKFANTSIAVATTVFVITILNGKVFRLATMAAPTVPAMPRQPAALCGNHAAAMAPATAACIVLTLTAAPVWQRSAAAGKNSALAVF